MVATSSCQDACLFCFITLFKDADSLAGSKLDIASQKHTVFEANVY